MIFIVLFARRFRLNPDNIATPVAGTIGDVLTLGILVGFSMLFYSALSKRVVRSVSFFFVETVDEKISNF